VLPAAAALASNRLCARPCVLRVSTYTRSTPTAASDRHLAAVVRADTIEWATVYKRLSANDGKSVDPGRLWRARLWHAKHELVGGGHTHHTHTTHVKITQLPTIA
jgi:hypothetical protein